MSSTHGLLAVVEGMLDASAPFERVEAFIERLHVGPDEKSALWLFAWVETDRATRRRAVEELLQAVGV